MRKDGKRLLPSVTIELKAPIRIRNAPTRPISVIACSSTNDFHEKVKVRLGAACCACISATEYSNGMIFADDLCGGANGLTGGSLLNGTITPSVVGLVGGETGGTIRGIGIVSDSLRS